MLQSGVFAGSAAFFKTQVSAPREGQGEGELPYFLTRFLCPSYFLWQFSFQ